MLQCQSHRTMTLLLSLRIMALLALVAAGSLLPYNLFSWYGHSLGSNSFCFNDKTTKMWQEMSSSCITVSMKLLLPPAASCLSAFKALSCHVTSVKLSPVNCCFVFNNFYFPVAIAPLLMPLPLLWLWPLLLITPQYHWHYCSCSLLLMSPSPYILVDCYFIFLVWWCSRCALLMLLPLLLVSSTCFAAVLPIPLQLPLAVVIAINFPAGSLLIHFSLWCGAAVMSVFPMLLPLLCCQHLFSLLRHSTADTLLWLKDRHNCCFSACCLINWFCFSEFCCFSCCLHSLCTCCCCCHCSCCWHLHWFSTVVSF